MKELNDLLQKGGLCSHISIENGDVIGGISKNETLGITVYRKGFSVRKESLGYKAILPGVKGKIMHEEFISSSEKEISELILDYYRKHDLIKSEKT